MKKSFDKLNNLTVSDRITVLGLSITPKEHIKKNLDRLGLSNIFQRTKGEKNLFCHTNIHTNFSILIFLCIKEHGNTCYIIVLSDNEKVLYFDRNFFQDTEKLFLFLKKDILKIMNRIDDYPKGEIKIKKDWKGHFYWACLRKKK